MLRWLLNTLQDAKHNRELYASGKANRSEVRYTAVGWNPGGFTDAGNGEYYQIVREAPAPPAKPEKQTERGVRNVLRRELGG